jgi:hypothetical protein
MTTVAHLRKSALALAETEEHGTRPGALAFTVRDKRFAALGEDGRIQLYVTTAETDEILASYPAAERAAQGARAAGVRIPLADIDGQQLNHWLRRAWFARAPRELAAQAAVVDAAVPGAVGDLPKAIGGPATRALAGAGVTTLRQVGEMSDADLLAMHGVGPKAVRILRESTAN